MLMVNMGAYPDDVMAISDFKARCLRVADQVARTGRPITITRHGRPLVEIVPARPVRPLAGSVEFLVDDDELIAPIDVEWDAAR